MDGILNIERGATGYRVLKRDEYAAAEGAGLYKLVGSLAKENTKYGILDANEIGRRWGEGSYLVLGDGYGSLFNASTVEVRTEQPTFYEWTREDERAERAELEEQHERGEHPVTVDVVGCPRCEEERERAEEDAGV